MKIGVISDTHSLPVPAQVIKDLRKMDLVIHAGDFCAQNDLTIFEGLNTLKAVYGNMDDAKVRKQLPAEDIFELEGKKFGLTHGEGPAPKVIDFVQKHFAGKKLDVVIFGHSHLPLKKEINGTLFFNPGSPNDTIRAPYLSYGVIEIQNKILKAQIIKIKG